jgi:hypothetical protein
VAVPLRYTHAIVTQTGKAMNKAAKTSSGVVLALVGFCASAQAETIQYNCGTKKLPSLILDYSADGKTVTALNELGKIVNKGDVLGKKSDQGIDYQILNSKIDPLIALRLTGKSRDEVTLKAGRHANKCLRM